jgi:hypothetical protein
VLGHCWRIPQSCSQISAHCSRKNQFQWSVQNLYRAVFYSTKLSDVVGSEILIALVWNNSIFWGIVFCKRSKKIVWRGQPTCFLLVSNFYLEDGSDFFIRNISWLLPDYSALYPRSETVPMAVHASHSWTFCCTEKLLLFRWHSNIVLLLESTPATSWIHSHLPFH